MIQIKQKATVNSCFEMSIKLIFNGFLRQMLRSSAVEIPSCVYAKTIIIIVLAHTHVIILFSLDEY